MQDKPKPIVRISVDFGNGQIKEIESNDFQFHMSCDVQVNDTDLADADTGYSVSKSYFVVHGWVDKN